MKKHIAEFVSRCLTCQKVKSEHKRPGGLLQPLDIHGFYSRLIADEGWKRYIVGDRGLFDKVGMFYCHELSVGDKSISSGLY